MFDRRRRACPICRKPNLLWPSHHLRQVHGLSSEERQRWLPRTSRRSPPMIMPVEQYPVTTSPNSALVVSNSPDPCLMSNFPGHCLDTQPHPEFAFQHPYSMMVVGPSQCGKTHFVHQLLTHKCMAFPNKKPWRVCWYYNQWQPKYTEIQGDLGKKIRFFQGLPEVEEDLSSIPTSKHTIIVLDDLMEEAKESPLVSKLFTQGRHRNASVILLLQNMFPKGKYNTDISRNATYKVLFRSPGDRKQIDIMAEQTFAKDRPRFMQAYSQETDRPYGYIVVDNHPRTASERQVVGNVFGDCYSYPHITSTSPPRVEFPREPLSESLEAVTVTRKRPAPVVNKSPLKKRKTNNRRVRKRPAPITHQSSIKKRKANPRRVRKAEKRQRVPTKKRKSKSAIRKQPVHDSWEEEEEDTQEEEEETGDYEEPDCEQGVDNEDAPGQFFQERLLRIATSSRNKRLFE